MDTAINGWSVMVLGSLPRKVPYVRTRFRTYVDKATKVWRRKVAKAIVKAGVTKPPKGYTMRVIYYYRFHEKDHADLDSITHSAQDAISKDGLRMVDKEYEGAYYVEGYVTCKKKERITLSISHVQKACRIH